MARSRTDPARRLTEVGTPPDSLAQTLQRLYGAVGLKATCREFRSMAELKSACPTIAVMKFGHLVDHYVTVLEVGETNVIVGDPLKGKLQLPLEEFKNQWKKSGIVLELARERR